MTSVWGVSAVAILDSSVNCVCVWSTKKLTMSAYCVAANCNNSVVSVIVKRPVLPLCVVDGRSRNPPFYSSYYYYYYYYYYPAL